MAIAKVLGLAIALGFCGSVLGFVFAVSCERWVGNAVPLVVVNIACVGAILGAIAGASQAVVDALEKRASN
jgi:hypothetical protein